MKIHILALSLIINCSFAQADVLSLWCQGKSNDGSNVSLLTYLDNTKGIVRVTWGDVPLINDPYSTSESMYSVTITEPDNTTVNRAFQLDRRSLRYTIIAQTGNKGWYSEGACNLDQGPKI